MGDPRLSEFNEIVEKIYNVKSKITDLKGELKLKEAEFRGLQSQVIEYMEDAKMGSFDSPHGKVVLCERFSVKQPSSPMDKELFFGFLKDRGVFEEMVSVHSRTLNAFYKQEMEAAKLEGNFEFEIPGIGEASHQQYIQVRGK